MSQEWWRFRILLIPTVIMGIACFLLGIDVVIGSKSETIAIANGAFAVGIGLAVLSFTICGAMNAPQDYEKKYYFAVVGAYLGVGSCMFLMASVLKTAYVRASVHPVFETMSKDMQQWIGSVSTALVVICYGVGCALALAGFYFLNVGLIDDFLVHKRPNPNG